MSIHRIIPLLAALLAAPYVNAETETWYTYWGVGLSNNHYGDEIDDLLDYIDSQPGVSRTEFSTDLFGFYWPIYDQKTMLGFVVNSGHDEISFYGESLTISHHLYSLSTMHFFGREIGDGLFLRADLGLAKASLDTTLDNTLLVSETGTGALFGLGYGIPISEGSRVLLGVNYTVRKIDGETISSTMFNVGLLW